MSVRLAIIAEPDLGEMAGLEGEFEWGTAIMVAPAASETELAELGPDFLVALGNASVPDGRGPDLRWLARPAPQRVAAATIAPGGEGLHGHALLPVRDELFALPPTPDPASLLVVSRDADRRGALVGKVQKHGLPAAGAESLTREGLAGTAIVAFLTEPGDSTMPASAPAVLAARRLLIAPPTRLSFGLLAGTDHLSAPGDDHVLAYALMALVSPRSFDAVTVLGRVTAEYHRASSVYGRLVSELVYLA